METNLKSKIETLMQGKNSFTIFLTTPKQGKLTGAYVQAGNFKDELEVMPSVDKIYFSSDKTGINVTYTRIYSDMPPSITNFLLSEVEKVEEILPTE